MIRVLEKLLKSFYLAIIGHMESLIPNSNVMHSALFNRSILSSVRPCAIRLSHTGNSTAEELDLSIGDFLF